MKDLRNSYGPWALITGASSGIGEEFANQLAAAGLNLVLIARNEARLTRLSHDLKQKYGVNTLAIAVDLSNPDFLPELITKTDSIEIGLLVSNAAGYHFGAFHKSDLQELARMLRLNTNTHMQLTHHFGNKMKGRGKGGILLVSTSGAFGGIPYMANYVAAKSYVLALGEALHIELKQYGVDVMVLAPGPTDTPGTMNARNIDNSKLGVSFMHAPAVVKQALKNFGTRPVLITGGMNKFSYFLGRIISRMGMARMLAGIMKKAMSPDII